MVERKDGEILKFSNIGEKDVYNPTAPFKDRGITYLAARLESRDSETDSQVMFFTEKEGIWTPDRSTPILNLQDPFVTRIGDELVLGGVVYPIIVKSRKKPTFKTVFYKGKDLLSLEKFAEGPFGMKDIRLVGLPEGKIGVFTRPQGKIGGKGKIGFTTIDDLDSLTDCDFFGADLIKGQFSKKEWYGVNEAHVLDDSSIGILGHAASSSRNAKGHKTKHYYPIIFRFNHKTKEASPLEIIAKRADFPEGESKRSPELDDVVFSGGMILRGEYAELYAGLSDANVGKITIPNPFKKE